MSAARAEFVEVVVGGMDCPSCAATIERHLKQLAGVTECRINFAAGRVGVGYDPDRISPAQVEAALARIGHPVEHGRSGSAHAREHRAPFRWAPERTRLLATLGALLFLLLGFGLRRSGAPESLWIAGYVLSMICGGMSIFRSAWIAVRSRHTADINVLMTVAAVGAAAIGDWAEAATVLLLFSVAEVLEAYSVDRTRQAIRGLMELAPEEATVLRDAREVTVPVQEVVVGETVVIRPGGRVPLDGEVREGRSTVNEASITGEAVAAPKGPGDLVYAGTLNEAGRLSVCVTHEAGATTLAKIVTLVAEAQARRSPMEQLVDRFARRYTPAVLGLAALLAIVPPLLGGDLREWIYRSLTLLIIACPCALVISTPVAMVCGLARAARGGALIKGGVHLERLGSLKALAFDKTGTLTHGRPSLADVIPLDGLGPEGVLGLAAAAEHGSEHAVGRAVVHAARERGLEILPSQEFEAIPGVGIRAEVAGRSVFVGRSEWLASLGYDTRPVQPEIERLRQAGKSVVLIARQDALVGVIAITDQSRPAARSVIGALRALGIQRIAMLTGDHAATARAVAAEMGIEEYYAELMPAEKVEQIQRLRAESGAVAMIGDGINDAPALAAANVGIAMGAAGTDVALETADVALMADDLTRLPFVIRLSRCTVGTIRQNIAFSVAVKAAFILLTLAGFASLWLAVLADTGTSLLVVLNSLRLLRIRD